MDGISAPLPSAPPVFGAERPPVSGFRNGRLPSQARLVSSSWVISVPLLLIPVPLCQALHCLPGRYSGWPMAAAKLAEAPPAFHGKGTASIMPSCSFQSSGVERKASSSAFLLLCFSFLYFRPAFRCGFQPASRPPGLLFSVFYLKRFHHSSFKITQVGGPNQAPLPLPAPGSFYAPMSQRSPPGSK